MRYTYTVETFDTLSSYWGETEHDLRWDCIFVFPEWLESWWREFGAGSELYLRAVRDRGDIIGIAPLLLRGWGSERTAYFMGSTNICDCQDFIINPGRETDFFNTLMINLRQEGILHLDLGHVRPESTVMSSLRGIAQNTGCGVYCYEDASSMELDLPSSWDDYLDLLAPKQRHEINRRLRRLREQGDTTYCVIANDVALPEFETTFLHMFRESREDKKEFMTVQMEDFFRSFARSMSEIGLFRLHTLNVDATTVAATVCFDDGSTVYLYNSGYDPNYGSLSVGLLCKVLCIENAIATGHRKFDFLKGAERYKHHLGGSEVPLYKCEIAIK